MSYYAIIDDNDIVINVISAEENEVNSGMFGDPNKLLKTSYNTFAGKHTKGGFPFRKNYAAIGFSYNRDIAGFVPPKPFPSWVLDNETGLWNPPIEYPADSQDRMYMWNEEMQRWDDAPKIPDIGSLQSQY